MRSARALLLDLLDRGSELWVEGDDLRLEIPKDALSARERQELRARKQEIVTCLGPKRKHAAVSFAQKRLWFLEALAPGGATYNEILAVALRGRLDPRVFGGALAELIRRHEILRTTFAEFDGEPVQVIEPPPPGVPSYVVVDLTGLATDAKWRAVAAVERRESRRPFNLARGPLLRALLLRLASREHVFHLFWHHIITDGWSTGIFVRELAAHYRAFVDRGSARKTLPPLAVQYSDFARWQRRELRGEALERRLTYWRRQLGGLDTTAELPSDRPRPPSRRFRQARCHRALPSALTQRILAFGRHNKATPFMTLAAGFLALLSRCTESDDVTLGFPIANRQRAETADLIGFFANTLVLRVQSEEEDPTFVDFLAQVRLAILEAYTHQDLPFEKLVEELAPARDLDRTPFFQILVNFLDPRDRFAPAEAAHQETPPIDLPGVDAELLSRGEVESKFDATLFLAETPEGLVAALRYNAELFDASRMIRLLGAFEALLSSDPERHLSELSVASQAETHQVLLEWGTAPPRPAAAPLFVGAAGWRPRGWRAGTSSRRRQMAERSEICRGPGRCSGPPALGPPSSEEWPSKFDSEGPTVVPLFEAGVARWSDAVAVTSPGEQDRHLSYRELDARAEDLAGTLRRRGVRTDASVGLAVKRSPEMVLGVLAILKAGAAYVPLDPEYPRDRLAFMMEECRAKAAQTVVLTDVDTREKLGDLLLGPGRDAVVLDIERPRRVPGVRSPKSAQYDVSVATSREARTDPESLAYVLYTSGSTGRPKGVALSHRALKNLIDWHLERRYLTGARILQYASPSFDASFVEMFAAWCSGGTLVLLAEARRDIAALAAFLVKTAIAKAILPVVVLQRLAEEYTMRKDLPALSEVVATGEELHITPAVRDFFSRLPGTVLRNFYGPTESHVVTAFTLPCAPSGWPALPSIGRPIEGTEVHLLGARMARVPSGAVGEIFLGGAAPARGYLGRSALSAEKFLPDPFARRKGRAGQRLYRTGDLARYRGDGTLEFLGRRDHQVKVRGYRIELGEIEAALGQHPAVREAVVVAREGRLVAYLGGAEASEVSRSDLRRFLDESLPDYMVPATFVHLAALPLSPTGKVDRRALPPPLSVSAAGQAHPRRGLEEVLAEIWAQVLDIPAVGARDNFFDLGGHSLLATRVLSRIRQTFRLELPVRVLFERPTVVELAELLERRRRQESPTAPPQLTPGLRPSPYGSEAPLSFAQQRLWFLGQLEPQSAAYHLASAWRLAGPLTVSALEEALRELVRRHEILRTTYPSQGGEPHQTIASEVSLTLPLVDLQRLPAPRRRNAGERLARREACRPFDLTHDCVLRVRLLRLADGEHILTRTLHHIASDASSEEIFYRELGALYHAFLRGASSPLPPLPLRYADFAHWQRRCMRGETLQTQLSYWRKQLAGDPPPLALRSDRLRSGRRGAGGGTVRATLTTSTVQGLEDCGRRAGATVFMVLLALFKVLLHRLTGQKDLSVGVPATHRNREELEGLLGLFQNTLVLRSKLTSRETFSAFLERVRETALDAYVHQEVPFEKLVEVLEPTRDLGRTPLFQAQLVLVHASGEPWTLAGTEAVPLPLDPESAKFDLTLTLWKTRHGLDGRWIFDRGLFDTSTICRVARSFKVLAAAVASPVSFGTRSSLAEALTVETLPLLPMSTRHQLVFEWGTAARVGEKKPSLSELIMAQAGRIPEAVAVEQENRKLSFRRLATLAGRLARRLRAESVGIEDVVAISMESCPEMVVAVLAILEAGGAYLPLEPSHPHSRLESLLEDSRATLVVTTRTWAANTPGKRILVLDEEPLTETGPGKRAEPAPTDIAPAEVKHPAQLAYLLYTSGSTGEPKAVAVEHRQLTSYLLAFTERLGFGPGMSSLVVQPLTVDSSLSALLPPLVAGGRLSLLDRALSVDPQALKAALAERRIDLLKIAPSHLAALVGEDDPEAFLPRRFLVIGGEASRRDWGTRLVDSAQRTAGSGGAQRCRIFHHYGPTEVTVGSHAGPLSRALLQHATTTLPLARPLAGTAVRLTDSRLRPVAAGAPGELCLGGAGLARGYRNRPGATAEAYVPDPFGAAVCGRLYRTGDLARYLPDGYLEFLGRSDHQLKIRGRRIEPGEIEAVLARHPEVAECAVIADGGTEERRLLAFLVARGGGGPSARTLGAYLARRLPRYLLPSAFVFLEALPRGAHGKVDRGALAAERSVLTPERESGDPAELGFTSPEAEILAGVWSDVLGVGRIGPHDDFFELGGHSLLATQLVSRIRRSFGLEMPLRTLFENPTVAELAGCLGELFRSGPLPRPPLKPADRSAELPLSFAQQRLWFLDRLQTTRSAFHIPLAYRMKGRLDAGALRKSLTEIVRRHEALRTSFPSRDGRPRQRISPVREPAFPEVDLGALPTADRKRQVSRHHAALLKQPFDLRCGPLFRAALLRLSPQEHVFLLTLHHIVSDGWSRGVLFRELSLFYESFRHRSPAPALAPLPVQYADFAVWERAWLRGPVLDELLGYWRRQLADLPQLELPFDRPGSDDRPDRTEPSLAASCHFTLSQELTGLLVQVASTAGASLYMTLVAALLTQLFRFTGQRDLALGSPIANRNRAETEGLVGFFVNTLVLRGDLARSAGRELTFTELLARVRETALGAYAHQDLPFEKLVEELKPDRRLERHPLFQCFFALHNVPRTRAQLAGLELRALHVPTATTPFAISLQLVETSSGLHGTWVYPRERFDATTLRRLAGFFNHLLAAAAASPERPLDELSLLPRAAEHQTLVEWNDTSSREPLDQASVLIAFASTVRRTPEAIAVTERSLHLSYAELDQRSQRLAGDLLRRGARGAILALGLERNRDFLIAVLAAFKAGSAYLPLDLRQPPKRLASILSQSASSLLLLADRSSVSDRSPDSIIRELDDGRPEIAFFEDLMAEPSPETPTVGSADLAYVLYTSGSTGLPKGAMVDHRGMLNHLYSKIHGLALTSRDTVAQTAPPVFDISVWQFLAPLLVGGRVDIVPDEAIHDPARFLETVERHRISIIEVVPAYLRNLLEELEPSRIFDSLRSLMVTGEALPPDLCRRWLASLPGLPLINAYGPTECSDEVATYEIRRQVSRDRMRVAIGRPIANLRLFVHDITFRVATPGAIGELAIAGAGVGRGYLNGPRRTAEVFVPDPHAAEPGMRLYLSGDLVRFRADGNLEFLARRDHQIKVRGIRVEPGEIEAELRRQPRVADAVVVLRRRKASRTEVLTAYLVLRNDPGDASKELDSLLSQLRGSLSDRLPGSMVPSALVPLAELPRTASGKIDRRALPEPSAPPLARTLYEAPSTVSEKALAEIFAELLGLERVGRCDDFFDLGGHSLLSVRLIAKIGRRFGIRLPLASLFRATTPADLAAALDSGAHTTSGEEDSLLVALRETGSCPPFFCVHPAGGHVWAYRALAYHLGERHPFYAFRAPGSERPEPFAQTIEALASRYLKIVREVRPRGAYALGGWSMGGLIAFEMARTLCRRGEAVGLLVLFDTAMANGGAENAEPVDSANRSRPTAPWESLLALARSLEIDLQPLRSRWEKAPPKNADRGLEDLWEVGRENGVLDGEIDLDRLRRYYLLRRNHETLMSRYVPQTYEGRILLFRPHQERTDPAGPDRGWGRLARGGVDLQRTPGTHATMMREPHVRVLAQQLAHYLRNLQ